MGKKDDKSSLYSCGGQGGTWTQGLWIARWMLYTLPHCLFKLKKGNQKQEVGKKYEENFELLNGHRNVKYVNAHIADRMWIINIQCIFILIVQYIHFILFR